VKIVIKNLLNTSKRQKPKLKQNEILLLPLVAFRTSNYIKILRKKIDRLKRELDNQIKRLDNSIKIEKIENAIKYKTN
jgi:hypothetical protein